MKKFIQNFLIALTFTFLFVFSGCINSAKTDENTPTLSPELTAIITNHPDIYTPETAEWTRTLYSGPAEQHEMNITEDFMTFSETAKSYMLENEWTLVEEIENQALRFSKDETMVTYSLNTATGHLAIFVEPMSFFE